MYRIVYASVMALAVMVFPGQAGTLPDFKGPVILTVTGLDLPDHPDGQARFDVPMLQALGQSSITTASIWTDGKHRYTGTPLAAVLRYLAVKDARIALHALNDYVVEMPTAEIVDAYPILAYDMDGAPMPVRDKGPIWVIYPYDDDALLRTDTTFTRSVWQLDRIDVLR